MNPEPDALTAAWTAELRPEGPVESWLVARAARAAARVDRLALEADEAEARGLEKPHDRLRRAEAAAERCVHQSLGQLTRARKQRLAAEKAAAVALMPSPSPSPPRFVEPTSDVPLWPDPRAPLIGVGDSYFFQDSPSSSSGSPAARSSQPASVSGSIRSTGGGPTLGAEGLGASDRRTMNAQRVSV